MKARIFTTILLASTLYGIPANAQEANDSCKAKEWSIFYYSDKGPALTAADSAFMEKYHVKYYHVNKPSAKRENMYAFQMLDCQYGKAWRKEINRNAIALKLYFYKQSEKANIEEIPTDRDVENKPRIFVSDCF